MKLEHKMVVVCEEPTGALNTQKTILAVVKTGRKVERDCISAHLCIYREGIRYTNRRLLCFNLRPTILTSYFPLSVMQRKLKSFISLRCRDAVYVALTKFSVQPGSPVVLCFFFYRHQCFFRWTRKGKIWSKKRKQRILSLHTFHRNVQSQDTEEEQKGQSLNESREAKRRIESHKF